MTGPAQPHGLPAATELPHAGALLLARQRADQELTQTRLALERQTRELELALSRLKATLDSTTDGILVTDEHARVTDFNENFMQMWQLSDALLASQTHAGLLAGMVGNFARPEDFSARVLAIYRDVTAQRQTEDRVKALHAGFAAHLSKPMHPPHLLAAIQQVIGRTA